MNKEQHKGEAISNCLNKRKNNLEGLGIIMKAPTLDMANSNSVCRNILKQLPLDPTFVANNPTLPIAFDIKATSRIEMEVVNSVKAIEDKTREEGLAHIFNRLSSSLTAQIKIEEEDIMIKVFRTAVVAKKQCLNVLSMGRLYKKLIKYKKKLEKWNHKTDFKILINPSRYVDYMKVKKWADKVKIDNLEKGISLLIDLDKVQVPVFVSDRIQNKKGWNLEMYLVDSLDKILIENDITLKSKENLDLAVIDFEATEKIRFAVGGVRRINVGLKQILSFKWEVIKYKWNRLFEKIKVKLATRSINKGKEGKYKLKYDKDQKTIVSAKNKQ